MKLLTIATLLASTAALVASAQPHKHHHHHVQKRQPSAVVIDVPGPTIFIYELNGKQISATDVQNGIKNGSLVWATGALSSLSSVPATSHPVAHYSHHSTSAASTSTIETFSSTLVLSSVTSSSISSSSTSTVSSSTVILFSSVVESSSIATSSSSSSSSTTSEATSTTSTQATSTSYSSSTSSGVLAEFPDGQIDCSTFPSDYGAVALDYLGIGGWTGIQQPGSNTGGFANIMTVTTGTCTDGNCCTEGSYCSYACPPGYQKAQWPSTQGATGQSVGGILCQNGKLRLTNPSMSNSLCMPGTTVVSVMVQNTMSKNAAVCRTDYPGTEGETIPLDAQPGLTYNLTCPDASHYYTWKGMSTSAQYYVNPAGVPVEDGCQWGNPKQPWGNYAPLNLGVGYSDNSAWLSIFQNSPTTDAKLDFSVEIVGNNGGYDNINGRCKYTNGQYCSGDNYESCSSTTGCTVAVTSGTATYVFS